MKKEEIKNIFIKYLKDNSHRITNERLLILESALSMRDHFDADELYLKMKKDYIRASRATVYKTLELMSECSILPSITSKVTGQDMRQNTEGIITIILFA